MVLYILAGIFVFIVFWQAPILFFFSLGMLIPVGATLFYHRKCFGGLLEFPYFYETYPQFALDHSRGIAGVTVPKLGPFFKLLVSPFRGIFFYSPFLIFIFPGIFK